MPTQDHRVAGQRARRTLLAWQSRRCAPRPTEWMRRLSRFWDQTERLVLELGPGPWFITVNKGSVVVSFTTDPEA
jgi:hypothetical protein